MAGDTPGEWEDEMQREVVIEKASRRKWRSGGGGLQGFERRTGQ